jgi:D-sedoheptulose 7-phosphate isomerase
MNDFKKFAQGYFNKLENQMRHISLEDVELFAKALLNAWKNKKQVFIFGNGGSAGNAIHLANDFLYGVGKGVLPGLKIHALPSNSAVLTCLANDEGYESIFTEQLKALSNPGDLAISFSGSGNSENIIQALQWSNDNNIETYAILGFDGGKAKKIAKHVIHTEINDMQISEDFQMIVGHLLMQWLCKNRVVNDLT